jgi:cytosine/adenosine deaminase-related metal-dependent hydrolase
MKRALFRVNRYNARVGSILRSSRVVLREHDGFVVAPARIHVAGALIERVERAPLPPAEAREQDQELDLGDRLVSPAFVNAHTHLALAFLRGLAQPRAQATDSRTRHNLVEDVYFGFEAKLTPEDVRAFARMGAYESLLHGVGCVWDHYYGGTAVADALLDTGLSGVVAPTLQDLAGPGKQQHRAALDATLQIAGEARYRERGVLAALGPHATDTVSPALLREVAQLAETHALPVHLHAAQSYDEVRRVESREGRSVLALLAREGLLARAPHVLLAHALFAHEAELRALDPRRHTLVVCPSSQLQFGFLAPLTHWCELGSSWVIGSDCASSNDSMNLQQELRLCAGAANAQVTGSFAFARFFERGQLQDAEEVWLRRKESAKAFARHTSSAQLLARVWHEPGAMHPALQTGAITPGTLANLAVWDTEHPSFWPCEDVLRGLAFGDTSQALYALYVAGRSVGEPGNLGPSLLASDAYRAARSEASARLRRLLA